MSSLAGLSRTAKLSQVKRDRTYKSHGSGTWAGFCEMMGFNVRKVDEDIKNLETFGLDFMKSAARLKLGYRDLSKMRALPEASRLQITDGQLVNLETADKDEIRDLVEDLLNQQKRDKAKIETLTERNHTDKAKAQGDIQKLKERETGIAKELELYRDGLKGDEDQVLKGLTKIKKTLIGYLNQVEATGRQGSPRIKAEASGMLVQIQDFCNLLGLQLAHFNGSDTPWAEVEMARADYDGRWGEGND